MRTAVQYSLAQYERMVNAGSFDGRFRQRVELIRDPQSSGYRTRTECRGDDVIQPIAFPEVAIRAAEWLGNAE